MMRTHGSLVWFALVTGLTAASGGRAHGATGDGLLGTYYPNSTLTEPYASQRVDAQINFGFSNPPAPDVMIDNFSVRWTGQVEAVYTETYTFYTSTNEGAWLSVNGVLLVDKWIDQAETEWSGTVDLTASQKYGITFEYYETVGGEAARLRWSSPSQAYEIIPQAYLYSATPPPTLVAHWELDDGSGGAALDSAGGDHNGTLTGSQSWTTGLLGGALDFDGTGDYVTIPSFSPFANGFSVALWARPTAVGSYAKFIDFGEAGPGDDNIYFGRKGGSDELTLNSMSGASGMQVDAPGLTLDEPGLTGNAYSVPPGSLVQGTAYYWKVTAVAGTETTGSSAAFTFTTGTPPDITITDPTGAEGLVGSVVITVTATDDGSVASVEFLVGGVLVGTGVAGAPDTWDFTWNAASVADGSHQLTAVATDDSGISATRELTILVANDVDWDGFSNLLETTYRTDPRDAASHPTAASA